MTRTMEQAGAGLERIVAGSLKRSPAGHGPVLAWPLACGHAVAVRTRALDFAQVSEFGPEFHIANCDLYITDCNICQEGLETTSCWQAKPTGPPSRSVTQEG